MSRGHTPKRIAPDAEDKPGLLDKIIAIHPGIIFGASAGGVTVFGCFFVLVAWLFFGPSGESSVVQKPSEPAGGVGAAKADPAKPAVPNTQEIEQKLRMILLAFHNYHDTMREFPASSTLSWRVHILPFLEQQPLYNQFHMNEPWDSPHNQSLIQQMPDVFRTDDADPNATRFHVLSGAGTCFVGGKKPKLREFTDGTSNTVLVVYTGKDKAAAWTSPEDLPFDPAKAMEVLGNLDSLPIICGLADAAVVKIPADIDPSAFAAIVSPSGNEIADPRSLARGLNKGGTKTAASATAPSDPGARRLEENGMKQILLAMLNHHDVEKCFPISNKKEYFDSQGKPLVSWRVHLLRYLDQDPLYNQFKLNEPWDSPHNKLLLGKMPDVYRDANDPGDSTTTRIVVLSGPQAMFEKQPGPKRHTLTDYPNQTIMCLQVAEELAVPWTSPDDAVFNPDQPLAVLGKIPPYGLAAGRVDGAVFRIRPDIKPNLFKSLVTANGNDHLTIEEETELFRR